MMVISGTFIDTQLNLSLSLETEVLYFVFGENNPQYKENNS